MAYSLLCCVLFVTCVLWISHPHEVCGFPVNVTSFRHAKDFNASAPIHKKTWYYPANITHGKCTLKAITKGMNQMVVNSLQDSKLIEYAITIAGYDHNPLQFKEDSLYYKPAHWARVASSHGQTILSLAFNYGVLSLKTLSFGIAHFEVKLSDHPKGCFDKLDEDTKILVVMDIVMKDFEEDKDIKVLEGESSVCHQYIDENEGVAQFTDRCCYQSVENQIKCIVNMPNKWLKILEIFLGLLTVTSFFFAPILMPNWIYRFAMNKVDYYVRLKEPLRKTIAVVRRKCSSVTDIYHDKTKIIDLRENSDIRGRPDFKECRRIVSQLPSDMIIPVKISQFDIKVNYKKLLVENNVPVGILDSIFHAIFMCRLSELQAFRGCCGARIVGDEDCLNRQSACLGIINRIFKKISHIICCCSSYSHQSKCRRRCRTRCFCCPRITAADIEGHIKQYKWISVCNMFGKLMLVLLLLLPFYLRLVVYFYYEHPEIRDRRRAADALGLTINFNHRVMQYLSPTHPIYIFIYVVYLISGIAVALFTGTEKKTKYQDVITGAFVDMNNLSMLKAFEMLIINLLWPFKKYGAYGLFIGLILWPLLLPISTIVCSIYCLPLVFVTCRIVWYIFIKKNKESEKKETPLSQKFLADNFMETLRSTKPMPVERERYCYCSFYCTFLLHLCLAVACMASIFSVMFFLTEIISFIAEIICFTLMGLIVNASTVLKYGTLFLLVVIYCYDSYSTVNKTYLKLNKTIFKCIKDRLGADIKAYTELPSELQGERGFKAQEADEQPDYEKPDDLVDIPFHWGINDLVMFVDQEDTPRIPKTLFDLVCKIEAAGAPGPVYRSLLKATQKFIVLLLFLGLVFIIVMSFGDSYQMSSTNQMLATMAGGFMPFMFKNIFRPARPDVETDLLSFKSKLDEIIESYYEIWPMTDMIFEIEEESKEEDNKDIKEGDCPPKDGGGDKDKPKKKKKNQDWLKSVSRITNVDLDEMKKALEDRDFEPAEGCKVDILIHASDADREWEFSDDISDYMQDDVRSEAENMNGAICMTASEASSMNSYAFRA